MLLFSQQVLHLVILRVLFGTFKYLWSTTTHNVTSWSEMSWFISILRSDQDISFIGFIKCVAHIILMILILSLNIEFLPAIGRDESTRRVVIDASIHALIQSWHLCLVSRLLGVGIIRNSLRNWIAFRMMLRFSLISIVLLSVMLQEKLFAFILHLGIFNKW